MVSVNVGRERRHKRAKAASGSTGIPRAVQARFEAASGLSFDDVRVHYNSSRPAQLGAYAYTQGSQVYIGPGQERHLEHELGHVIQQKRGLVKADGYMNGVPVNRDPGLERAADLGANQPVQGFWRRLSGGVVQMQPPEEEEEEEEREGVGTLTGSLKDLTPDEQRVVDDLVGMGKNVEIIPRSKEQGVKTPDFRVDGVLTELKTIKGTSKNTPVTRISDAFKQGAETVIIDARDVGLTSEDANQVLDRAAGKYPDGLPGVVEIWTTEGIIRRE